VCGGYYHSLALDSSHNVWAWGKGSDEQLGLADCISVLKPVMLPNIKAVTITAGEFNSAAITADGDLLLWGNNNYGQLGVGDCGKATSIPILVKSLFGNIAWRSVDLGPYHVVAITDSGDPFYWGRTLDANLDSVFDPTPLLTDIKVLPPLLSVSTRAYHALYLSASGEVYSVGVGEYGQLGIPNGLSTMKLRLVPSLQNVTQIAAGSYHSLVLVNAKPSTVIAKRQAPRRGSNPATPLRSQTPQSLSASSDRSLNRELTPPRPRKPSVEKPNKGKASVTYPRLGL